MLIFRNKPRPTVPGAYPQGSGPGGVDLQLGSPSIFFSLHVDLIPQPVVDQARGSELGLAEDNSISRSLGTPVA
jgi:hypothetical protein